MPSPSPEQQQQQRLHKRRLKHNLIEVGLWGPWAAASCGALCGFTPSPGRAPDGAGAPTTAQHHTAALSQQQQQLQQQQCDSAAHPQLDVSTLSTEVAALEALLLHAERLADHGSSTQAVLLLTQALARADSFAVPCVPSGKAAGLPAQGHTSLHQAGALPAKPLHTADSVTLALGPLHGLRVALASTLLRLAIADNSWTIALHAARLLTPAYKQLYPP